MRWKDSGTIRVLHRTEAGCLFIFESAKRSEGMLYDQRQAYDGDGREQGKDYWGRSGVVLTMATHRHVTGNQYSLLKKP